MPRREEINITRLKYVLYARRSTKDKEHQVQSVPHQIKDCKEVAERYKLNVVKILREDESAKTPNQRPIFDQMLKDIEKGKYDAILTWHPDRLARNMLEGGRVIDLIDRELLKDLKFHTHYFENNSSGKVLLGLAFVFAKNYTDELQERITRGNVRSREDKRFWGPKHGYVLKEHSYKPDGKNFKLLRHGWQKRKSGEAIKDIAKWLHEEGYMRVAKKGRKFFMDYNKLGKIFKDTFYYGLIEIGGDIIDLRDMPGFEPMVSEEDFEAVQQVSYKQRPAGRRKNYEEFLPLRYMILCGECGKACITSAPSNRHGTNYLRYSCAASGCPQKHKSVRGKEVFDYITKFLKDGLNYTKAEYDKYLSVGEKLIEKRKKKLQDKVRGIANKRSTKERERDELAHSLLQHSETSRVYKHGNAESEKIDAQIEQYNKEAQGYQNKVAEMRHGKLSWEQFLNLSKNASTKIKAADAVGKDAICRLIFLNLTLKDKKIASHVLREPFKSLLEMRNKGNSLSSGHGEN